MKFCDECGFELSTEAVVCPACGFSAAIQENELEAENQTISSEEASSEVLAVEEVSATLPVDHKSAPEHETDHIGGADNWAEAATAPLEEQQPIGDPAETSILYEIGQSLGGGRYTIVETPEQENGCTRLVVMDERVADECRSCQTKVTGDNQAFCDECGARLDGRRFLITGATYNAALEEALSVYQKLDHPNLLKIYDSFSDTDGTYWVSDITGLGSISSDPPEELALIPHALNLLEGLSFVHEKQLYLSDVGTKNFRVHPNMAQLQNLMGLRVCKSAEAGDGDTNSDFDSYWRPVLEEVLLLFSTPKGSDPRSTNPLIDLRIKSLLDDVRSGKYSDPQTLLNALKRLGDEVSPPKVFIDLAKVSHIGKEKDQNEDSCGGFDLAVTTDRGEETLALLVLADGMGGHEAGEVASRIAVAEVIRNMIPVLCPSDWQLSDAHEIENALKESFVQTHHKIIGSSANQSEMGTTLVAAALVGNTAYIANVGDSRAYIFDGQELKRITSDHSLVALLAAIGQITEDEIYTHPRRNEIMRVIGVGDEPEVDTFSVTFQPGDTFLLCSDGLWEMVRDNEIKAALSKETSAAHAAQKLVRAANANGGLDNISVVVAKVNATDPVSGGAGPEEINYFDTNDSDGSES